MYQIDRCWILCWFSVPDDFAVLWTEDPAVAQMMEENLASGDTSLSGWRSILEITQAAIFPEPGAPIEKVAKFFKVVPIGDVNADFWGHQIIEFVEMKRESRDSLLNP